MRGERLFTVASSREQRIDYGVLETDGEGSSGAFTTTNYEVSMGIYMVSRESCHIPENAVWIRQPDARSAQATCRSVKTFDGYWLTSGARRLSAGDREFEHMKDRLIHG
jgi:hypothetical protein